MNSKTKMPESPIMGTAVFNDENFWKLKAAYNNAIRAGKTQFIFDGNDYLVSYAKYLIEYLGTQLK